MAARYIVGRDRNVSGAKAGASPFRIINEYDVDENGNITPRQVEISIQGGGAKSSDQDYINVANQYTAENLAEAQAKSNKIRDQLVDKKINAAIAPELQRNALAEQIRALTSGGGTQNQNAGPEFNNALAQLSAGRN